MLLSSTKNKEGVKEMSINRKTKRISKIISVVVILTMIIGNIFGVNALTVYEKDNRVYDSAFAPFVPNDPLKYMQNIPVEPCRINDDLFGQVGFDRTELPEPDDGSTDRYIVKYKANGKQSFQNKLAAKIAYSEEIGVSVNRAISFDILPDSNSVSGNGEESILHSIEWEVLTLNEKILPSEFAEIIRNNQALGDIEYIQPDYKLSLDSLDDELSFFDDSAYMGNEYISEFIDDESIISSGNADNEIIVAVIDTGVDIYHDDLAGYIDAANMWDFTQNTNEIYSAANPLDSAHGTHIAGIIAKTARENGVYNIKILPLRVFDNGFAYSSDVIAAVAYAAEAGASIINCSFGSTQENPALEETIANANALFVCAAGNNRRELTEKPSYPACYALPNVISVASVNADGGFSYFSNYGANVDITALGRDVLSTLPEKEHGKLTGTSMSAGYVAAVAAIVNANEDLATERIMIYQLRQK